MRPSMGYCYSGMNRELDMNFTVECEQEVDGRWIAEVPELPGVLAYGTSSADAEVGAFYWTVPAPDIVNLGREEQGSISV